MSTSNDGVLRFIERELEKNPGVNNATLFEGAKEIDGAIAELSARQFHAKYPLQVKRRLAMAGAGAQVTVRRPAAARAPAPTPQSGWSEEVLAFVQRKLEENPGVKNAELIAGACEIDASVGELSARQFHGKYRLQARRRLVAAEVPAQPPETAPAPAPAPVPAPSPAPSSGWSEEVLDFVRGQLEENPGVKNAELFAGACEIDASVAGLSPRQFHAKYPLQVKRRLARVAAEQAPARPAEPEAPREPEAVDEAETHVEAAPAAAEAPAEAAPAEAPSMGDGDPAGVRALLMNFARDLANAGTQVETIDVLARLDAYVSDIMNAARS